MLSTTRLPAAALFSPLSPGSLSILPILLYFSALLFCLEAWLCSALPLPTIFQKPPQSLVVWQMPVPLPTSYQRPRTWEEKNFGQWCRNFTVNTHRQCPEASVFHWYVCCGDHDVECCFGIQTWVYVVFGLLLLALGIIFIFFLLLRCSLFWSANSSSVERLCSSSASSMLPPPSATSGEDSVSTTSPAISTQEQRRRHYNKRNR